MPRSVKRSHSSAQAPARRRHGAELEAALLDAAWDELCAVGYPAFTLDGVATRAGTSRPVLARRWTDRTELIIDALRQRSARVARELPDTGTLRGDVLALLRQMSDTASEISGLASFLLAGHYQPTGLSPAQIREQILSDAPDRMAGVIDLAIQRGEIEPGTVTPGLQRLPLDLVRHDVIMTNGPIDDERLTEIVDELFLPLITTRSSSRNR